MACERAALTGTAHTLQLSGTVYGLDARNRLEETTDRTLNGARAALETFYCAFNRRDLALLRRIWLDDPLIQLNNPLGGVLRGIDSILELYSRVFHGPGKAWVRLENVLEMSTFPTSVFAGREIGEYARGGQTVSLSIRTSRFFAYAEGAGWRQLHHHGSIDESELLASYQAAVAQAA